MNERTRPVRGVRILFSRVKTIRPEHDVRTIRVTARTMPNKPSHIHTLNAIRINHAVVLHTLITYINFFLRATQKYGFHVLSTRSSALSSDHLRASWNDNDNNNNNNIRTYIFVVVGRGRVQCNYIRRIWKKINKFSSFPRTRPNVFGYTGAQ
jgi:hypothetical protein|uniref:Uncharacterized protein n=1 Tax=Sipha flava TaxID=143950 RepID=A0A2S2QDL6_9HEMI